MTTGYEDAVRISAAKDVMYGQVSDYLVKPYYPTAVTDLLVQILVQKSAGALRENFRLKATKELIFESQVVLDQEIETIAGYLEKLRARKAKK